jgi:hypothetical protein
VLLPGDRIDEAARALRIALDIDWQHAPFTRCIVDNRPLEAAAPYLAARVPERSQAAGGPLRLCPECGRLYCPEAMSAGCSGGLLPGKRRRPHPANSDGLAAAGERGGGKSAPGARGMEWPRALAAIVSRRE